MRVMRPCKVCGKRYAVLQGPGEVFTCAICKGNDGCPKCGVNYEWVEEPGLQSRALEWVRDCPQCHCSPDRRLT